MGQKASVKKSLLWILSVAFVLAGCGTSGATGPSNDFARAATTTEASIEGPDASAAASKDAPSADRSSEPDTDDSAVDAETDRTADASEDDDSRLSADAQVEPAGAADRSPGDKSPSDGDELEGDELDADESRAPSAVSVEIESSHAVVVPGDRVTVNASGFRAQSTIRIVLFSTPTQLGSFTADAEGRIAASVHIPASTAPGLHELSLQGVASSGRAVDKRTPLRLRRNVVPVLESFSVVSSGPYSDGDTIRVDFTYRADSADGLHYIQFRFVDSIGRPYIPQGYDFSNGTGSVSVTLDDQAAAGPATLELIELRDTRNNSIVYRPNGTTTKYPNGLEGPTSHAYNFNSYALTFESTGD